MQLKRTIVTLGIAGVLAAFGGGMGGIATAPPSGADNIPVVFGGDPVTRQVQIGDRFYTVSLVVTRWIPGAPVDPPQTPTTTVTSNISINDGALLPANLDVVGVRFERLRGANRFFFVPMEPSVIDPDNFEQDIRAYRGDMSDRPNVQRLRATVRIKNGDQVIRVPMGVIEVQTVALP